MSKSIQVTIQVVNDNDFHQNTYFVTNEFNETIIVDPGYSLESIVNFVAEHNSRVIGILLTHYHFDHVASVEKLCEMFHVKAHIHKNDLNYLLTNTLSSLANMEEVVISKENVVPLEDGMFDIEGFEFKVVNVKGHSDGSAFFIFNDVDVFTGDALFFDTVGRNDLPGSSVEETTKSIQWMKENLGIVNVIYPGHGRSGIFADVLVNNPYLK